MKPTIRKEKFLGINCIKIKEYPDYEKYYLFKMFLFKKRKNKQRILLEKVTEINEKLNNFSTQLIRQQDRLKGVEWYFQNFEAKINLLDIKSDNINNRLNNSEKIDKNFNTINEKINNQDKKLLSIEDNLNKKMPEQISQKISQGLSTAFLHQKTFSKYKNIHQGKEVVLLATGPTLNQYEPIKNAIHVGVNSAFMFDKVKLDYLFMLDYQANKKHIIKANNYERNTCKKFYGLFKNKSLLNIPENEADIANAQRYYINDNDFNYNEQINYDISTNSLACFWSVIFQATQFALYTNPEKIYLVGCDCNSSGHFNSSKSNFKSETSAEMHLIKMNDGWKKIKEFAQIYYSNTEIVSINPVGLKGLFKDIYTEEGAKL